MADFPFPKKEEPKKQPAGKKGFSLFSQPKQEGPDLKAALAEMSATVNDVGRRLLLLEERFTNINKKIQVIEQNIISSNKKLNTEIKTANSEVDEVRKETEDIKSKILLIIKELKLTAKKEDFEIMKKYLEMWEPLKYVTQNEVEKIVRSIMQEGKL